MIRFEEPPYPNAEGASTLVFAGDVFVDPDLGGGRVREALDPALAELVGDADFSAVNLEGPLVEHPSPVPKVGPHLAMAPAVATELRDIGVDAVTLANNHTGDHGAAGLASTLSVLNEAGIRSAGAGASAAEALRALTLDLPGGTRLALLAVSEAEFGIAGETTPGVAPVSDPAVVQGVITARESHDLVVVASHGGIEELPVPPLQRRRQLRALVHAGADLVIGHHPHVAQGWEVVGRGAIFFSTGDFLVDHDAPNEARDWGYLIRAYLAEGELQRVGVVPYERLGDTIVPLGRARPAEADTQYLEEVSALVGGPELEPIWQELAVRVFETRYLPFLADLGVPAPAALRDPRGTRTMRAVMRALALALPGGAGPDVGTASPTPTEALTLRNLLRCESHRWTIETAMAVLGGECEDLRGPETAHLGERLAQRCGFDAASPRPRD